ncbi:MAG TPA: hypothetical protein VIP98_02290 [Microlunatus sp.]
MLSITAGADIDDGVPSIPVSTAIFIGGPAASGKTTIARLIARKRGLRWYSTDAHGWSHRDRAIARGLHDENDPSPGDFDRGPFIQEDLDQLTAASPTAGTVIEGALLTPHNGQIDSSSRETERTFDCECGLTDCTRTVQLRPVDAIQLCNQPPGAIQAEPHIP